MLGVDRRLKQAFSFGCFWDVDKVPGVLSVKPASEGTTSRDIGGDSMASLRVS